MKRICFLIGNMSLTGGTERVTSLIANGLASKGHQISILSLSEGKHSFFEINKEITLHSLFDHQVSMKKNFIGCCYKVRQFVKQHDIDTIIVVDSILCVFTVPALIGLKIQHICWEHFNFNVDLGVSFRRLGRKWAAKYCDYVVTLTRRDKELWEQGLKNIKAKIVPIANPTPYENIENTPSLEYKTVLAMGRLTYQKGFDLLLDAWAFVCKKNHDWTLKIVGSGEDELKLKEQAKRLDIENRVIFISATKDVQQYFRTSSFFCLSSRFEGFGMVMIEAQSFSLPIIAFNCDAGPSDIIENEMNGFLVTCNNVQKLSERIIQSILMNQDQYNCFLGSAKGSSRGYALSKIINHWLRLV